MPSKHAPSQLYKVYYPMEINPDLTHAEKAPLMCAWWEAAHSILIDAGFRKPYLATAVQSPDIALREGTPELLQLAQQHGLPVHILSAGLYDVITSYMHHLGLDGLGAYVVSNEMIFDPLNDRLTGFQDKVMHSLNKNGYALMKSPGWAAIKGTHTLKICTSTFSWLDGN